MGWSKRKNKKSPCQVRGIRLRQVQKHYYYCSSVRYTQRSETIWAKEEHTACFTRSVPPHHRDTHCRCNPFGTYSHQYNKYAIHNTNAREYNLNKAVSTSSTQERNIYYCCTAVVDHPTLDPSAYIVHWQHATRTGRGDRQF